MQSPKYKVYTKFTWTRSSDPLCTLWYHGNETIRCHKWMDKYRWREVRQWRRDTKQRHEKANAFNKRQSVSKCNENVDNEKPKTIAEKMLKNRKGEMTEGPGFFFDTWKRIERSFISFLWIWKILRRPFHSFPEEGTLDGRVTWLKMADKYCPLLCGKCGFEAESTNLDIFMKHQFNNGNFYVLKIHRYFWFEAETSVQHS